jgi:hypothetical protein
MRRLTLLVLIALVVPVACKKAGDAGDGGADGAASASASSSASAAPTDSGSASASATATVVHASVPAPGVPCRAGTDTNACSPDKTLELTCSGGRWAPMQSCRGAGACKGSPGSVSCDLGNPIVGDPCVPGATPAKCVNRLSVQQCNNGKWSENPCTPPTTCKGSPASCQK